jgi:hypothetical protein
MIPFANAIFMQSVQATTPPPDGGDPAELTLSVSPTLVNNQSGVGDTFGIGSSRAQPNYNPLACTYSIAFISGDPRIYNNAQSGPSYNLGKNYGFAVSGLAVGESAPATTFRVTVSTAGQTVTRDIVVAAKRVS